MRSFNANFNAARGNRADGPAPVNLLTFDFATPVYLSDRDVTPSGGSAHQGLVKSWGFVDSSVVQTPGSGVLGAIEICDLQLTIINSESPRFSDNFTESDPPENVTVTLYQWFDGLIDSEKEILFKGIVYGQPTYDEYLCKLTVRGIFEKYNKRIGADMIIDADTFPSADPDDIGKMSNICFGSLPKVPCRAVKAGVVDTLDADLNDSAASFTVSGAGKTEFASGTVVVQIDSEQIQGTYTPATNTFSSCTRGYNSTTATAHNKGTSVAEVLTSYVYEVAGHPVKAIDAVYVDDVLQDPSSYDAYTGQSGAELSGYEGRAVIEFAALPVVAKSVTIAIDDGLTVSDDIEITTPSSTKSIYPSGGTAQIIDGSEVTNVGIGASSCSASFPSTSFGSITTQYVHFTAQVAATGGFDITIAGGWSPSTFTYTGLPVGALLKLRVQKSGGDWDDGIGFSSGGTGYINEVWSKEVIYTPDDPKSGNAYRAGTLSLTGNSTAETVIGQRVTADVDGYQDDALGTYTGSANALIERPDHVFKFLWCELLGLSAADLELPGAIIMAVTGFDDYVFALLINDPINADNLLMRLALQCRSRFIVKPTGKARLGIRLTGLVGSQNIPKNEIRRDSLSISRSPTAEIFNVFNIHYGLDLSKSPGDPASYAGSINFQDATSISRYGQREWKGGQDLFCFDAVRDADMAESVGDYLLMYHCRARAMPKFGVFLDNMEVEPGDIVAITHDLDGLSGFNVEVLKLIHHLGNKKQVDFLEITGVDNAI